MGDPRRAIPSVDRILARSWCLELTGAHGRSHIVETLRAALRDIRRGRLPLPDSDDDFARLIRRRVAERNRPSLRRVVNATGVVLHTNLGRAPLAAEATRAMTAAAGYGNVEFDLESGRRGSRYDHCVGLVRELTGAGDALVVNNNAGAVALALAALAGGKGVAVSHGEMVEIGGGFRIPEVVEAAGARIVAVGTTNRTRVADYARAIAGGKADAILKVHRSNFSISGFTGEAALDKLVALGAEREIPVIHDLGSGLLLADILPGGADEPTPAASVAAGATLVAFSGDKLLGGPQAGVLAGTVAGVARAKAHPLCRALRCDKATLAGLEATLALYRDPDRARARIPALAMIGAPVKEVARRARAVLAAVGEGRAGGEGGLCAEVVAGNSLVGGGSCPDLRIPSAVIALGPGEGGWTTRLRAHDPPVIARRSGQRVILDLRTVAPEEDAIVVSALRALARSLPPRPPAAP